MTCSSNGCVDVWEDDVVEEGYKVMCEDKGALNECNTELKWECDVRSLSRCDDKEFGFTCTCPDHEIDGVIYSPNSISTGGDCRYTVPETGFNKAKISYPLMSKSPWAHEANAEWWSDPTYVVPMVNHTLRLWYLSEEEEGKRDFFESVDYCREKGMHLPFPTDDIQDKMYITAIDMYPNPRYHNRRLILPLG